MELSTAKAISMLALGLGSFASGMAPAFISKEARHRHPLFISCLLCFGAGVLLSTSLMHMLPEAREKLPEYSELMLCVGFFIVYIVDEIVHYFYGSHSHSNHNHQRIAQHSYGSVEQTSLLSGHGAARDVRSEVRNCREDDENPRICHVNHTEPCNKSYSGIVGLLVALFVHSLLEGLVIGLQENASQVLLLLAAVASHKYVVGFCLGAELCAGEVGRLCTHMLCIVIFSGGSVLGIALGATLDAFNVLTDSIADPIMQSLAAGTLLYVTVSEVLPRERARWHERKRGAGIAQLITVVLGFALMYFMTMYIDHDAV